MASGSSKRVYSGTTAGNTVDVVVLTDPGFGTRVENVSGNAPLWFTVSTPGGPCPIPTVGGSVSEYCASSVVGAAVNVRHQCQFGQVVQLISAASVTYTVEVVGVRINA